MHSTVKAFALSYSRAVDCRPAMCNFLVHVKYFTDLLLLVSNVIELRRWSAWLKIFSFYEL